MEGTQRNAFMERCSCVLVRVRESAKLMCRRCQGLACRLQKHSVSTMPKSRRRGPGGAEAGAGHVLVREG